MSELSGGHVQIQRDVREFIQKGLVRDVRAIKDDESLLEAGVVDSLGVLALIEYIERRYGLQVTENEMMPENFETIGAIAAFVERRLNDHA
jgi:acyl carrier protein